MNLFNLFSKRSQTDELVDSVINTRSARIQHVDGLRTAVAATDAPVPMFDFERMEVVDEILVATGGKFPERVPLLDTHDRSSVFKVFGSAINPRREAGEWLLDMEFDDDEDSKRAEKKVSKKHVRDVSIGYNVLQREFVPAGQTKSINGVSYTAGERTLKVSTQWEGTELSLAPIGADRQAKIRSLLELKNVAKEAKRCDQFAALCGDAIIDLGLTRSEVVDDLSLAAGIEKESVEKLLAGEGEPTSEIAETFAAVLETDAAELQEAV